MAAKNSTHLHGLKSPWSVIVDDLRGDKFHPWEGTQDDLMTSKKGRKMRSSDGDSSEPPTRRGSSSRQPLMVLLSGES
jgi:hypothetical protein